MAKFNLIGSTTVAELKKAFHDAFGSQIKVYQGRSEADDATILSKLGLKADGDFECRSSLTAGNFIERMAERGLKVTIWTRDYFVKVLDGLTLESTGKVKDYATKKDMEDMIAYQRKDDAEETPAGSKSTQGNKKYTIGLECDGDVFLASWIKLKSEEELESLLAGDYGDYGDYFDLVEFMEENANGHGIIMDSEDFEEVDFELIVEDEDGNEVYKSNDPGKIRVASPKSNVIEDGVYLFKRECVSPCPLNGTFETDDFNPSKFCIGINKDASALWNTDMVDFRFFSYDNKCIDLDLDCESFEEEPEFFKMTVKNGRSHIGRA